MLHKKLDFPGEEEVQDLNKEKFSERTQKCQSSKSLIKLQLLIKQLLKGRDNNHNNNNNNEFKNK